MLDRDRLESTAAAYKDDARRRFDDALTALIALGFKRKDLGENFLWDADPELQDGCLEVLRGMSDACVGDVKGRCEKLLDSAYEGYDFDDAWDEDGLRDRFDMEGSHLMSLLEIWLALAFVNGMTQAYLKISVIRYLSNPYASPMWGGLPGGLASWGRGYDRNIINQMAVIGQNAIMGTARYIEWQKELEGGATYYIRRRGSDYHCDECQSLANIPIPIDIPFEISHSRCMCYPEYHYEQL